MGEKERHEKGVCGHRGHGGHTRKIAPDMESPYTCMYTYIKIH